MAGTRFDTNRRMQTIQFSVGEAIEAMYEELLETYGDEELARAGAQAVGDELLTRFARPALPQVAARRPIVSRASDSSRRCVRRRAA
jgi:hypothetical protein